MKRRKFLSFLFGGAAAAVVAPRVALAAAKEAPAAAPMVSASTPIDDAFNKMWSVTVTQGDASGALEGVDMAAYHKRVLGELIGEELRLLEA